MPYVEIYKLQDDGTQKVIAVCRLQNGEVICEGDEVFAENLKRDGISDYSMPGKPKIYPKDGRKFIEQLRFNFTSGYLNASEVKE